MSVEFLLIWLIRIWYVLDVMDLISILKNMQIFIHVQ